MNINVLYFMVSYLATGVILLAIAAIVYLKDRDNKLNIVFSLYSFAIAWWSLFSIPLIMSDNLKSALFWDRVCLMGTVFIPTMFVHFIAIYLKLEEKYKIFIKIFYMFSFIFLALDATPYYVATVEPKKYINYFTSPGPFYYVFVVYFTILATLGTLFIFIAYKKAPAGLEKKRLFYLFWANAVGYFGGSLNYSLSFNMCTSNVATIGNYLTTVYSVAIAYIIFKYRFLDVEVIIKKTIIFGGLATFVFSIAFFSASLGARLIGAGNNVISSAVTAFVIALLANPLQKWLINLTENFLFQKEYNQQQIFDIMSRGIMGKVDLEELKTTITKVTADTMKLESAFIIEKDEFKDRATIDRQKDTGISIPIFLKGKEYWILCLGEKKSGKAFTNEDKKTLLSFSRDISLIIENAKLQMDALRQKNLEFVSVLVKNLAHEIFNPLTPLQHSVEDLEGEEFLKLYEIYESYKDKYSKEDETKFKEAILALREATKSIKTNAQHIQLIVDTLNKMQKGDEKTIGPMDIKMFFKEVVSILSMEVDSAMQKGVNVDQHIERGLLPVTGNPTLLKQVLINLYKNACYAMKNSAEKIITISCNMNEANSNELLIEFSDTGAGIPAETISKLFAYGFTTKGTKGSGIGLNQCKAIIEKFGGNITVKSEVGKGAVFTITLPVWKETENAG